MALKKAFVLVRVDNVVDVDDDDTKDEDNSTEVPGDELTSRPVDFMGRDSAVTSIKLMAWPGEDFLDGTALDKTVV